MQSRFEVLKYFETLGTKIVIGVILRSRKISIFFINQKFLFILQTDAFYILKATKYLVLFSSIIENILSLLYLPGILYPKGSE